MLTDSARQATRKLHRPMVGERRRPLKMEGKPDIEASPSAQAPARNVPSIVKRSVIRSFAYPSEDRRRITERLPPALQAMLAQK
jgi:hypothetical protein